jgi:hypothetical protein
VLVIHSEWEDIELWILGDTVSLTKDYAEQFIKVGATKSLFWPWKPVMADVISVVPSFI